MKPCRVLLRFLLRPILVDIIEYLLLGMADLIPEWPL